MTRGKQRNPTFVHINIRVTREVNDYFFNKGNRSEAIREVLEDYVRQQTTTDNPDQLELPIQT
jgi:metal-responsive CopG/Arc/MetJ family transcriptional regulator